MKKLLIIATTVVLASAAPASAQSAGHILRGAGIGAAGGAVAGALIPGLSVGNGALVGAAAGGTYNVINKGHHRKYRSRRSTRHAYHDNRRR